MDLFFPDYPDRKFHLKLFSNVPKEYFIDIYSNDQTLILDADYVFKFKVF